MSAPDTDKRRARLPVSAVALTLLTSMGLAGVVAEFISSRHEPVSGSITVHSGIGEVLVRLERLEQRLSDSDADPGRRDAVETEIPLDREQGSNFEPERSAYGPSSADVYERLARLEVIEQRRQDAAQARAEQLRAQFEQATARASEVMLDPTVEDRVKIESWAQIRMNAQSAWTDEIVAEAVRIGTTSTDPMVRANVWRQAHAGRTHPLLLQPLLFALTNDPETTAREEAAETLDLYLDQPGVLELLQTAAQYDADPAVRRQATISLGGPQGGF